MNGVHSVADTHKLLPAYPFSRKRWKICARRLIACNEDPNAFSLTLKHIRLRDEADPSNRKRHNAAKSFNGWMPLKSFSGC